MLSVSQRRICSDNCTCCHTEIEVADPTFYLTQSQYTDTGPTSPSADPNAPGAWQGSHWSANFLSHWYDSTPKKSRRKRDSNPGSSDLEADALTTRPTRQSCRCVRAVGGKKNEVGYPDWVQNHNPTLSSFPIEVSCIFVHVMVYVFMCRHAHVYEYDCLMYVRTCTYCICTHCMTVYSAVRIPLVSNCAISHLISSRLCPSTAGCSPPSMSSIFVCLLPS